MDLEEESIGPHPTLFCYGCKYLRPEEPKMLWALALIQGLPIIRMSSSAIEMFFFLDF